MKLLKNTLTLLIELIHWYCFIITSFFIFLLIWDIITGVSLNESIAMILFKGDDDSDYIATTIWIALIMPFIKYIIFRSFVWLPWSPFTKKDKFWERINKEVRRRITLLHQIVNKKDDNKNDE
jgi:hypothetical protein